MIKKLFTTGILGLSFSLPVCAGTMGKATHSIPVYAAAAGGYGHIDGAYGQDGNFTQGRFAIGLQTLQYRNIDFGAEAGVQSGNNMRLSVDDNVIALAGGLQPQATLKPLVDILATARGYFSPHCDLMYILKGGIAYRQFHFEDRTSQHDYANRVSGEFQGGFGYPITEHATLTAFYQGIYGGSNAKITFNSDDDLSIGSIPTQQAGFLGLEYKFF
jgi:hypothetical protein